MLTVLEALPDEVVNDFLSDSRFTMAVDQFTPGKGRSVWMAPPDPNGNASRSVILKPRLDECDEMFALYIIAHELAHAYLHNGGWNQITDPEDAADALAASWGFSSPLT